MTEFTNNQTIVELRAARIPWISLIAVHYWFVICQGERHERWEVWQKPNQKAPSWGHLHKNLLPFDRGVGCGESWIEATFADEKAQALITVLQNSPSNYPHHNNYHYWPGPNSNSFVQWVLDQAKLPHHLKPQGIGKNHMGLVGWQNIKGVKSLSTPLLGIRFEKGKFYEIHLCHLALSVQFGPLRLHTFVRF